MTHERLPSLQLDAFVAVARERHFSNAAKSLNITQSALSQRILLLEERLKMTLFIRRPHQPVTLTDAGETLLGYCVAQQRIVDDALLALRNETGLSGHLRIAGFSSIMRSLVLPALAPVLRDHSALGFSMRIVELHALGDLLLHGEADFVLTNEPIRRAHVRSVALGNEHNVLVRGKHKRIPHLYLDHDARDLTTTEFIRSQSAEHRRALEPMRRMFLDDIYALYDGVVAGLGRAVLPEHLVDHRVVVESQYRTLTIPVYLNWLAVPYESPLEKAVVGALSAAGQAMLGQS